MKRFSTLTTMTLAGLLGAVSLTSAAPRPAQIRAAATDPANVTILQQQSADTREFAQAVAQTLWLIAASEDSEAVRRDRMARVMAAGLVAVGAEAETFVAMVAERVHADMLPVISAAAVLASRTQSPAILQALLSSVATDGARTVILNATRQPLSILTARTAAAITATTAGTAVASASSTPDTQASEASLDGAPQTAMPVTAAVPQVTGQVSSSPANIPPPPRGEPIPPRGPAIPYRGQ